MTYFRISILQIQTSVKLLSSHISAARHQPYLYRLAGAIYCYLQTLWCLPKTHIFRLFDMCRWPHTYLEVLNICLEISSNVKKFFLCCDHTRIHYPPPLESEQKVPFYPLETSRFLWIGSSSGALCRGWVAHQSFHHLCKWGEGLNIVKQR